MSAVSARGWLAWTTWSSGSMAAGVVCPREPSRASRVRTREPGTTGSTVPSSRTIATSSLIRRLYARTASPQAGDRWPGSGAQDGADVAAG